GWAGRGWGGGRFQLFLPVAGMVAVITAVLAGSAAGVLAAAASGRSLAISLAAGALTGLVVLTALTRLQSVAWRRADAAPLFEDREQHELAALSAEPACRAR